jgi:glycerophosphodiester phosphodiesterase
VPFLERTNVRPMWANSPRGKPRSRSLTTEHEHGAREIQDRVKHTVDYMNKGFKPNTRGDFIIHDSFATLEELLVELPKSISFDIEISMYQLKRDDSERQT